MIKLKYIFLILGLFNISWTNYNIKDNNLNFTISHQKYRDSIPLDSIKVISKFEVYIQTELRQILISSDNDGTINPRADDAGNWTGCACGKGKLVGTFRDISACAFTGYYNYEPTVEELRAITYRQAKTIYKWFWDNLNLSNIPDQDIANITMHIKLHFGNIKIIQIALNNLGANLTVDGIMGPKTNKELVKYSFQNSTKNYNEIRTVLEKRYENASPVYKKGFLKFLKRHFPKK